MTKIKKILDDFNKIPVAIVFLIVIMSCAFSSIPGLLVAGQSKNIIISTIESMGLNGQIDANRAFKTIALFSFVATALVSWGIMELVLEILYRYQNNRRCLIMEKKTRIKNSFRLAFIIVNTVSGFWGLGVFLANTTARDVLLEMQNSTKIILEVILYTLVYFALHGDSIREDKIFTSYSMLYHTFVIAQLIRYILSMIFKSIDLKNEQYVISLVFSIINVCLIVAASIILYFFMYKKTKKLQIEFVARNSVYLPDKPTESNDSDIFGGDYNI